MGSNEESPLKDFDIPCEPSPDPLQIFCFPTTISFILAAFNEIMTSEVAVMNKIGIALAADSAVTIDNRKYSNTGNKIFQMIPDKPIGIMFFNRTELMGMPWELLLWNYNKTERSFDTLIEYVQDFLSFLESSFTEFQVESFITTESKNILRNLQSLLKKVMQRGLDDEEIRRRVIAIVENQYEIWSNVSNYICLSESGINVNRRRYGDIFSNVISEIFPNICEIEGFTEQVSNLILLQLSRLSYDPFNDIVSGVVIAGYGDVEIFPSYYAYLISGKVGDDLLHAKNRERHISYGNPASVAGFGQKDTINSTFVGMSRGISSIIEEDLTLLKEYYTRNTFDLMESRLLEAGIEIPETIKDEIICRINRHCEENVETLESKIKRENRKRTVEIASAIAHMSREELASISETFVELEKFMLQISLQAPTVGGPVDVVVISKTDGFQWVKKK
jgi:hypothetical protein